MRRPAGRQVVASIVTETVGPKLGCHNVKVTTASSLAFLEQSSARTVHPDAWITEAAVWLSVYNERRADDTDLAAASVGRVVASTPVVLAVPASLANADTTGPHNWIDALAKLQLSAAAPGEYAPAALAFTAVWQMFANLPGGEQAVSEPFFEIVLRRCRSRRPSSVLPTPPRRGPSPRRSSRSGRGTPRPRPPASRR